MIDELDGLAGGLKHGVKEAYWRTEGRKHEQHRCNQVLPSH